jgi:hypothetical protein
MKYRKLLPNEIEAYNIGYQVGSRQCVIKVLEFESPEEKKFYRQGYNAGCQDRKRHNVSTNKIESNVSNVSNVTTYDSTIAITNTIVDTNVNVDNKRGVGEKEKGGFVPPTLEEVLEYAREQNNFAGCGGFACTPEQAEEFWSYYESQGWRIGNDSNTPIRDWKPKLRQWHIKAKQVSMKQATKAIPRMSYKEMKEMQNEIEVQKILNGER